MQHFSDLTAWELHLNRTGKLRPHRTRLVFSFQPGGMQESRTDRAFLVPLFINYMEKCLAYFLSFLPAFGAEERLVPPAPPLIAASSSPAHPQPRQSRLLLPAWRQRRPTLAGLAPLTYPHPEVMRLIVLVLSAWKMYRLNGQDKRTGRRHSSGGFCRRSSEKTIVTLYPPALVSSCYHTTFLLNRLQGFLAPPCHPFGQCLASFRYPYLFARNAW